MKIVMTAITLAALLSMPADTRWRLDLEPNHSTVEFEVPIAGGMTRVTGKFKKVEVVILYDDEDMTKSSVMATIAVDSIDTGIDNRDRDLQGKSFFDGTSHPEITFRSTRIQPDGEGFIAAGELSMRGVTKPVELPFTFKQVIDAKDGAPVLGVAAGTTLNRNEWGVGSDWVHSVIPNFIGDEVTVRIFLWTHSGEPVD